MRRRDREVTDIRDIEKIIQRASHCRIGLVDKDEPYVVPVCFGYERNVLYFHSAPEGRKIEIIKNNAKVCFELDTGVEVVKSETPCGWTMKYQSVVGVGKASILKSDEEKSHGLGLILGRYTEGDFSFPKPKLDSTLVVKIDIKAITGKKSGY